MKKKFLSRAGLALTLTLTSMSASAGEAGHADHAKMAAEGEHAGHEQSMAGDADPHAQHKAESEMIPVGAEQGKTAPTPEELAAEEKARRYFTDLEVVDQNGTPMRFYSDVLKGRVVLMNFIFTNCKDACPMATQKMIQVRQTLVDAVRDDVWFVSISIDPDRDTPGAMKAFAEKMGVDEDRWLFITGKKENMVQIVKRLGQYTEEVEAHSTLMLAGNDRTRHWTRVMPMVPPEGVAQQLRALAEERSDAIVSAALIALARPAPRPGRDRDDGPRGFVQRLEVAASEGADGHRHFLHRLFTPLRRNDNFLDGQCAIIAGRLRQRRSGHGR